MGSAVALRKGVLDEIVARARSSAGEVCGLLLGDAGQVADAVHCANVAADPAITFEIEPGQLIAALRAGRAGGAQVVGCYHSHPRGAAVPSRRDAADAAPTGWLWLIVGGEEIGIYRAVADGEVHGRFTKVACSVTA